MYCVYVCSACVSEFELRLLSSSQYSAVEACEWAPVIIYLIDSQREGCLLFFNYIYPNPRILLTYMYHVALCCVHTYVHADIALYRLLPLWSGAYTALQPWELWFYNVLYTRCVHMHTLDCSLSSCYRVSHWALQLPIYMYCTCMCTWNNMCI